MPLPLKPGESPEPMAGKPMEGRRATHYETLPHVDCQDPARCDCECPACLRKWNVVRTNATSGPARCDDCGRELWSGYHPDKERYCDHHDEERCKALSVERLRARLVDVEQELADAKKDGDRRGEEERAKALEDLKPWLVKRLKDIQHEIRRGQAFLDAGPADYWEARPDSGWNVNAAGWREALPEYRTEREIIERSLAAAPSASLEKLLAEERAKALERVAALEKQLSEWRVAISRHLTATKNAPPTAVHCEACELADGGWCRSCAPLAALLGQPALAAAPSGDAKGTRK